MAFEKIKRIITEELNLFTQLPDYKKWIKNNKFNKNDLIVFNNTFLYRAKKDIKTKKSDKYFCLKYLNNQKSELCVCTGIKLNRDYKKISFKAKNQLQFFDIDRAISNEIKSLGNIVFVLIGSIQDDVLLEKPFNHSFFSKIILDPALDKLIKFKSSEIIIKNANDYEIIWKEIEEYLEGRDVTEEEADKIKSTLDEALNQLNKESYANLNFPGVNSFTNSKHSFIDNISNAIYEQIINYEKALKNYKESQYSDNISFNEILRIAYNFNSDVIPFLRLIISICDLKPIILWTTISKQFKLSDAFKELPWVKSPHKQSLGGYGKIIGDARNKAFHKLIPFKKTIKFEVPPNSIQDAVINLFPEHKQTKHHIGMDFRDREIIEVLLEFTRTAEKRVPDDFWEKNLIVMEKAAELFKAISKNLKIILEAVRKNKEIKST
ncbi:MAG: hypothetical protein K9L87_04855 [Candidatus Omnitrophica bacterium]|nr:hypothetical protein [Candidatus Omnitrophota bacterium]MCF7895797.1 hypothetical protein [Candidatus Omnitrophota bacterium]MCF7898056.1 hypothetical protein [Candidatus Omnitrophota bacterium]